MLFAQDFLAKSIFSTEYFTLSMDYIAKRLFLPHK